MALNRVGSMFPQRGVADSSHEVRLSRSAGVHGHWHKPHVWPRKETALLFSRVNLEARERAHGSLKIVITVTHHIGDEGNIPVGVFGHPRVRYDLISFHFTLKHARTGRSFSPQSYRYRKLGIPHKTASLYMQRGSDKSLNKNLLDVDSISSSDKVRDTGNSSQVWMSKGKYPTVSRLAET